MAARYFFANKNKNIQHRTHSNLLILFDHILSLNFFVLFYVQKDKFPELAHSELRVECWERFASETFLSRVCAFSHQTFPLVKSIKKKSINFLSKENESFLCFNLFIFASVSLIHFTGME